MKKSLIIIACVAAFASCDNSQPAMTENEIQAKVDSLVGVKVEELNQQAMEDLDRRKAIEVKEKADSIVAAHKDK